jgi:hypothetical protein
MISKILRAVPRAVIYSDLKTALAGVSKPGQPRGTQDPKIGNPFPQGFVGSNPTPCTLFYKNPTMLQ